MGPTGPDCIAGKREPEALPRFCPVTSWSTGTRNPGVRKWHCGKPTRMAPQFICASHILCGKHINITPCMFKLKGKASAIKQLENHAGPFASCLMTLLMSRSWLLWRLLLVRSLRGISMGAKFARDATAHDALTQYSKRNSL